ncbi:MAG TPA: hypothetical protein DCM10_07115 [Xanthomarina gelatinilytica]|jgi:hypothetical protein|nr:hypothetical protein [Xanthomarina gelatinilytica]|tara:strand:- start:26 stop:244 length:219 start_codon:yes stop_codon:yes gene_type:complete
METNKLFTKMSIDEMKSALADREMDLLDFHTTYSILMGGCKGYDNMSDEDIEEQYITYFGDTIKKEVELNFN